ncbi:MAG: DUF4840 domain-containing protein [Prevotella sp.]
MKQFRSIALQLMALVFVGGMLASCLNDDDNNNNSFSYLSKSEQLQAYGVIAGNHAGRVYWVSANGMSQARLDSADVTLNVVNDSTAYIYNFPTKPLADTIKTEYSDLKAAMLQQPNTTLTIYTRYFRLTPIYFQADPYNITYNVTYGGANHKVEVAFYTQMPNYLFGAYDSSSKQLQIVMNEGAVWVDRENNGTNPTNHLITSRNFLYKSI